MKIIIIFIAIVFIKIAMNTFRYFSTKYYYIIFLKNVKRIEEKNIFRCIPPVSKLFENAGTQRDVVVHIDHNFYNTVISTQLNNSYYTDEIIEIFEITLGIYSQRIRESVYPLYWLNLPLTVLEHYIGHYNLTIPYVLRIPIKIVSWSVGVIAAYFLERFLDSSFVSEKIQEFLHILK